eukprot:scaffold172925_cov56-Attheya_sp.AAC.2
MAVLHLEHLGLAWVIELIISFHGMAIQANQNHKKANTARNNTTITTLSRSRHPEDTSTD